MDFFNINGKDKEHDLKRLEHEKKQEELEKEKRKEEREQLKLKLMQEVKDYLLKNELREKMETITLTNSFYEFDKEDYTHSYLFVSDSNDGTTLTVEHSGLIYSIVLHKGINRLNILQGSYLTVKEKSITVKMIKTNYDFM